MMHTLGGGCAVGAKQPLANAALCYRLCIRTKCYRLTGCIQAVQSCYAARTLDSKQAVLVKNNSHHVSFVQAAVKLLMLHYHCPL